MHKKNQTNQKKKKTTTFSLFFKQDRVHIEVLQETT